MRYPFGYGIGFTEFSISYKVEIVDNDIIVTATVKNIGKRSGKEVIEVYYSAPDGKIGAYITKGIAQNGGYATIKHFCCNNQEKRRSFYDVVISERALREIYLKPFEIAVKEGGNVLIMTSYNSANGFWCASNYDLTTTILREEWKFDNLVMPDWWEDNAHCIKLNYSNAVSVNSIIIKQ